MPRRRREPNICPRCGTRVREPVKTWQLVSPFPDSRGRITITIMGVYECPSCGYRWRAVVSKLKVGGSEVEIEGAKGRKRVEGGEERKPYVIELDLSDIEEED